MITLLSLGLYRSSGGPVKSIQAFEKALNATVISWVDPEEFTREILVWEEATLVRASRMPVLKQLQIPIIGTSEAEALIARSRLVSVHSFWRWHVLWLHRVCMRHKVPYWYVPHGSLDPYVMSTNSAPLKRLFMAAGGKAFLRDAATIIYSTDREREKAVSLVGHDRSEVIHWPLDNADFRSRSQVSRNRIRNSLGIPQTAITFLYLGRLSQMKRPIETIEAFSQADCKTAHLIVVGNDSGVSVEACRAAAQRYRVADRTHVLGAAYGAEKHAYIDAADVYISLSQRENFNFTAAEAMASGLPLILSPGNDLTADILGLPGVFSLVDTTTEHVAKIIQGTVAMGIEQLEALGVKNACWASRNLNRKQFDNLLNGALERYALIESP